MNHQESKPYMNPYLAGIGLVQDNREDKIHFPKINENPTKEQMPAYNKIKSVSLDFGDSPQTGSGEEKSVTVKTLPKMEMKALVKTGKTGKKKKDGC